MPFFKTFTLWHIRLNIYLWKTRFFSREQYLFDLSYLEMQRRPIETKAYNKLSNSVWKERSHKLLKVANAKKPFPSGCTIDTTCFDECFLFHVIAGRHYFLYKFIVTQRFGTTTMLLRSLKQVFWKKSTFYSYYPHNNTTMLLIPKVQNKNSTA